MPDAPARARRPRPVRSPALFIAAFCLIETLSMGAAATFPTLIPVFRDAWRISNTEAGWISGIYFGGYVVAVAVLTSLTDRVDAKRIYLASLAISVCAPLGFALSASGLWSASAWQMLQGMGLAGTYMPGLKALTDVVPQRLQSRATAFYTSSFGIGTSLSFFATGLLSAHLGWEWTFGLCALGPLAALLLAAAVVRPAPPRRDRPATALLDFRPVLANRRALGFTLAYAAHNAELFALRAWLVSYLVFVQANRPPGAAGTVWSAASIAALANLAAVPSSILGNELSLRIGRQRTAIIVMAVSAAMGVVFGLAHVLPFVAVAALALCYSVTVAGESSTLTAGLVAVADPRYKGATIAVHSVIGFCGSLAGPIAFGAVLDAAGGESSGGAWTAGFAAMSLLLLFGPLAIVRLVGLRERIH